VSEPSAKKSGRPVAGGAAARAHDDALVDRMLACLPVTQQARNLLAFYELPRIRTVFDLLERHTPDVPLRLLNIGFLNGVVPFLLFHLDRADRLHITSSERGGSKSLASAASLQAGGLFPAGRHDVVDLDLDRLNEDGTLAGWETRRETFDWVLLGEVIEHIPSIHAPKILRFFHRVLAPGGRLVITTPNLHGFKMRLRHLLGIDFTHDPLGDETMGYPHVNLFSSRQLCDLARANRFAVNDVLYRDFTAGPRRHGNDSRAVARAAEALRLMTLSRLAPAWREDLILCFQKRTAAQPTSPVYGAYNSGFLQGLRAVAFATRTDAEPS